MKFKDLVYFKNIINQVLNAETDYYLKIYWVCLHQDPKSSRTKEDHLISTAHMLALH